MKCTYPGCIGRIHGRGKLCPAHQRQRWLKQELRPIRPIRLGSDPRSRLAGRYETNIKTGCWEWIGTRNRAGYGYLGFQGKEFLAHRFAYITMVGPIEPGMIVCHTCDNPPCINPAHLFLGTHQTNAADKVAKKRHPRSKATACKHGHTYTPESSYIDIMKSTGKRYRRCRICIAKYNSKQ